MVVMGLCNRKASNVQEDTWLMKPFIFYRASMSKETPMVKFIYVFLELSMYHFSVKDNNNNNNHNHYNVVHSISFNAAPKPHRPVRVLQAPQNLP
jgi:hypothetical protein